MEKENTSSQKKTLMGFPFYHIRDKDVMSDHDAAEFLDVKIGAVWDIMKYRGDSFKADCFLEPTPAELQEWIDQLVINPDGGIFHKPVYFFTQFGLFTLSIFLNSKIARQFSYKIGEVLFNPRKLPDETIVSQVLEKLDKNEALKAKWALYRIHRVQQKSRDEPPEG